MHIDLLKMKLKCLSVLMLIPLLATATYESNPDVVFRSYSLSDGLPHISVTSLMQDSRGFVFISTYDGLGVFDGNSFRTYKSDRKNENSLIHDRVHCTFEHSSGKIFVGTEQGICLYDPVMDAFMKTGIHGLDDLKVFVHKMVEAADGRLWILTRTNLLLIACLETNRLDRVTLIGQMNSDISGFNDIAEDINHNMWIITPDEIICYNEDLNAINVQFNEDILFRELTSMKIDNSNNHLWIASFNGFFHFSIEMNSSNVAQLSLINHYLPGRHLSKILFDRNGAIWLTEFENGLYRFILDNQKVVNIEHYTKDSYSDHSLKGNTISCLFEDRQGGIWAGIHNFGLNYYNTNNKFFQNFSEQSGLPGDHVISICKYDSERVLLGTFRQGVGVYNFLLNRIEPLWFDASGLLNKIISDIFVDSRKIIWIVADGLVFYLLPETNKLVHHRQINTVLNSTTIQTIGEDDDGHIWVGHLRGLARFGLHENGGIIGYISFNDSELNPENIINSTIKSIYNDPVDKTIWVGTYYDGLYKVTPKQEVISGNDYIIENYTYNRYNSDGLQSNFISDIYRDSRGRLWIATEGGGLSQLLDPDGNTRFINYTESEGLSHNVTKAIIEDNNGKFLITTNSKLNYFDPESGRFVHYGIKSGLKSIYFTSSAVKTDNGKVVFGGNQGISIISLESFDTKPELIKPYFARFFLFSEEVRPGQHIDNKVILNRSLYYTDKINLKHNQNNFSVELSGVGFTNTEHSIIRYRLKGYDNDWIYHYASGARLASYSRVPPGSYTLEYSISDTSGDWGNTIKTLSISISPVFWRTKLAILFYVIAFCLIIYYTFYILLKIERLKGSILITQMEKEKEHSISEAKLKFFTNISHEFRTPLTLINGPVEHILSNYKLDNFLKHNLHLIKKQSNYLLRLLDQLLEFRKAERGALELKWYKTDIVKFIWQITKSYDSLAINNNIRFEYLNDKSEIILYFDPKMIEKVIYNLLSNAFKFTPGGGKISLHIQEVENTFVKITVRDSGSGISDDEIDRVFEIFFQGKNTNNIHGTGIGLSLSKVLVQLHGGKIYAEKGLSTGAEIVVELPLGKDHLKDSGIIRDDALTPSEIYIDIKEDDPAHQIFSNPPITGSDEKQKMVIVDDNADMRNFIAEIFRDEFTVFQYADGNIALNRIKKIRPDIVISDLMMPVMDGLELCRELRSDPATNHTLFIILTGQYSSEMRIKLLQQGADDFIIKPFQVDYLRIKVKNLIENRTKIKTRYNRHFIKRHFKNKADKDGEEFLYTVTNVIQRNIANISFTNDDFSRALAMSSTKFYQKLKALTGKSPNELVRDYRLRKAAELLSNEDYTIDEVIGICGFCSRPYFYKCFKEAFKITPLQYKTQQSGNKKVTKKTYSEAFNNQPAPD